MDIHKPKPVHSIREFLSEIAVVVCGILIAIGLEQAVEALHWREAVSNAREALHVEIARNNGWFVDRLAVAPCIERHIVETGDLIESAAKTGRTPNVDGVALAVAHFLDTSEWEAQKAAQTLVHFPPKERSLLSVYYRQAADLADWRDEERAAWDGLSVLDGPSKHLSDADIAGLRVRLRQIVHLQRLIDYTASDIELQLGRRLGVTPIPPNMTWRAQACRDIHTS